jgi:pimeloyl-ACP methyl ester carboxylesterase
MPTLISGKVNAAALPTPDSLPEINTDELTLTELRLLPLWRGALPVKHFGRDDNFFDLGGDSLSAVQFITRLNAQFKVSITPAIIYNHPSLRQLAAYIDAGSPVLSPLVPLNPYGSASLLIGVPGHQGYAMHYRQLCAALGHDYPVYAFQHPRYDRRVPKFKNVEALAQHYVESIRQTIPDQPFYLIGASVGGLIALEMARQLNGDERVLGLILLDTYLHEAEQSPPKESPLQAVRATVYRLRRDLAASAAKKANLRVRGEIVEIARAYQPKPYAGKLIFFSCRQNPHADKILNQWRTLAQGEFVRIDIDAQHELLREEHVHETARHLRAILRP